MRIPRRTLVAASAAGAVVFVGLLLLLWGRQRQEPAPSEAVVPPPAAEVREPVITHAEQGRPAWELQLREVQISTGGRTVTAMGVRDGVIYGAGGKPVVRVTADRVNGDTATRDFEVSGNVNVVSSEGTVFNTDLVRWDQKQQKITCPGEVTMRNRLATISTFGLAYYVNESRVQSPNQIKMTNGDNALIGRNLVYSTSTGDFRMDAIQAVFNAEEMHSKIKAAGR